MKKCIWLGIIFIFSACTFMQEIYEPRDLLLMVRSIKDKNAPTVTVTEPTNGQEVAPTYQIVGTAVDNGVKTETAGVDNVFVSIDGGAYTAFPVINGNWLATFSNNTEGWHTNRYFAADLKGNCSATNLLVVNVQTAMPILLVTKPASGILTNKANIYFEGVADIGAPYELKKVVVLVTNTSDSYRASYNKDEKLWNLYLDFAEGTNYLLFQAIASSAEPIHSFDRHYRHYRANISVENPSSGDTVGSSYTLNGTLSDNLSGIVSLKLIVDTNSPITLNYSGNTFSTNVQLPAVYGTHTNILIAMDKAGNSRTKTFTIIRAAVPVITCKFPSEFVTNQPTIALSGLVTIDPPYVIGTLQIKANNINLNTLYEFTAGQWCYTNTMSLFSNYITLIATGTNGSDTRKSTINTVIYYDDTIPSCTPASLPSYTNVSTIVFRGTASDNFRVAKVYTKRDGDSWTLASGATNWTQTINLTMGSNTLRCYAMDTAGNTGVTKIKGITFEQVVPTVTVNAIGTRTNTNFITVSGSSSDASGIAAVYVKVNSGEWTLVSTTASWSKACTLSGVSNTIYIYARDNAGNSSITNTKQILYLPLVTFNTLGGTSVAGIYTYSNTTIIAPASPTKAGYGFCGWCSGTNAMKSINFATNKFVSNTTLYARWLINGDYSTNGTTATIISYTGSAINIILPDTVNDKPVTTIGYTAFITKSSITNIVLPSGLVSIGDSAFKQCYGLKNITLPVGVTSIGSQAFMTRTGMQSISLPNGLLSIGDSAFNACSSLKCISIPSTVTSIGTSVFQGCTVIKNITLPIGLTSIKDNTFYQCKALTNVNLPSSVTYIGKYAFLQCYALKSIVLPSALTNIATVAFNQCTALKTITIPTCVVFIGNNAFTGCSSLTNVTVLATTPPTMGTGVFDSTHASLKIYVPLSSTNAYKNASGWSAYAAKIVAIP